MKMQIKKNISLCPEYFLWYATISWDVSLVYVHLLTEEKLFVKHGVKFHLFSRRVRSNVCPEEEKIIREGEILRLGWAKGGGVVRCEFVYSELVCGCSNWS